MKAFSLLLLGIIQLLLARGSNEGGKRVMCYYIGMPNLFGVAMEPEHINATLCTHLVYLNGHIDNATNSVVPVEPEYAYYENGGKGYYDRLSKLKEVNPRLKILLHVHGCCNKQMPTASSGRSSYIRSAVSILQRYGFDGLQVHWVTPRDEDLSSPVSSFDKLLTELRAEFDKHGYLIATYLPGDDELRHTGRNIDVQMRTSDIITVETIYYWGPWKQVTGIFSPLDSVRHIIDFYISKNVPANKMHILVPTSAIAVYLEHLNETGIGAAAKPPSDVNDFDLPNSISYGQLVKRFKNQTEEWNIHRNEASNAPYASNKDGLWVSYEDSTSVAAKCQCIQEYNLGGVTLMTLEMDDYLGNGGEGRYPLTRTASDIMTKHRDTA